VRFQGTQNKNGPVVIRAPFEKGLGGAGRIASCSDIFKRLTRILGPEVGSLPSRKNLLERLRSGAKMLFSLQHCENETFRMIGGRAGSLSSTLPRLHTAQPMAICHLPEPLTM